MLRKLIPTISSEKRIGSGTANPSRGTSVDGLYHQLRSGLWGLLIFLAVSIIVLRFNDRSLVGTLPANIMEWLGSTPSTILVNCVFGASTVSSLIVIGGRIYHNLKPGKTSTHLWFRVFFYVLYFVSGALSDYFNVVFISGLVVLGLQHYNVWNYYMLAIETTTDKFNSIKVNN
ncbi:MAG: hypothetical protein PHY09_05665 [Desulfuromonadaceae bacterium]|nr:hypothetical protein [Desulfuromonadaceae bacterium]MDD5107259.1 hypothetical protein [Desulfuromonadaceae bacterium]